MKLRRPQQHPPQVFQNPAPYPSDGVVGMNGNETEKFQQGEQKMDV